MKEFSASLLFQYRVILKGRSSVRRICEERIVLFKAQGARTAVAAANRIGSKGSHSYTNDEGNLVHFEFIGVQDIMHLGVECEPGLVWYTIRERLRPMERRAKLVLSPQEQLLRASR